MTSDFLGLAPWYFAWAISVPLIVLNLIIHIVGLAAIHGRVVESLGSRAGRSQFRGFLVTALALIAITFLHAVEAAVWAAAYLVVGALSDFRAAMLYSVEAITSYGHESTLLEHRQMMGALEALNGMILFGLTTAFLFAMIQSSGLMRRT